MHAWRNSVLVIAALGVAATGSSQSDGRDCAQPLAWVNRPVTKRTPAVGQLDTCRGGWVIAYGRNRFHVDFERDGRYQVTGTDESGRPFRDGDLRGTLTVARALGTVEQVPLASGEAALVGKGQPVSGIASARFVIELGVSGRVAFDLPFAPGSRRFTGGELQATLAASAR